MAGLGKLAKLAWKGISYLPKKAHSLQCPFIAPAGGQLSKGQKVANTIFKATEYTAVAGFVGVAGAMCYESYQVGNAGKHKEYEEHNLKVSKYFDTLVGTTVGFLLGGAIGALALGAAAYLTPKDLLLGNEEVCNHSGKSITLNELRQAKAAEAEEAQEAEKEEKPEVKADKNAVEKFCKELENLQVGQSITVPELSADSGKLKMQAGEQGIELAPGDKITRTEDGFEIVKANNAEKTEEVEKQEEQAEYVKKEENTNKTDEEQKKEVEKQEKADSEEKAEEKVEEEQVQQQEQAQQEEQEKPVQETKPTNNIFGGAINGITTATHDVVKGDCLWNIAKQELQKANPGKTISNGQILAQVKEFIRLNPQIKNPDLIYPSQQIKMCA